MTNSYERALLLRLADRLARRHSARSIVADRLSDWAERHDLGFAWDPETCLATGRGLAPDLWADLRARLANGATRSARARPDTLERNARLLAAHLRLTEAETQIFALAVRAERSDPLKTLCDNLTDDARMSLEEVVTVLTGLAGRVVARALHPGARLATSGLLRRESPACHGLGLSPSARLLSALDVPAKAVEEILERLFTLPAPPDVGWEDFAHLGPGRDFALQLLQGALAGRIAGVNILLHGAPGTGKTEFCKVLAARLDARLHAVGEADDDGDEPTRNERLQQLRLGQRLLSGQGRSLILFDEMEDLFPAPHPLFGAVSRGGSKVHMNRLVEGNAVPTLWTTNDIAACDPALMRRITFTLTLRTPPAPVRARVWQRLSRAHGMPLAPEDCARLARSLSEAPALADSALRAARLAGGGIAEVRLAAEALSRAVNRGRAPISPGPEAGPDFDPTLANADHDLAALADRLAGAGPMPGASLCLTGPPGTGKSAYARHLAGRMGMEVLERRASDLLDPYIGGTERNIAEAFAEARDTGAFLILDEADTLLSSREGAHRRWEVSQVNEMLTWMEAHPLPFACTTNLAERLDPASLRRFGLRLTFLPLDEGQRAACFRRFFGVEPPRGLAALDLLTPGDFASVARRARLLGIAGAEALLSELAREQAARPGARAPAGFRAA